MNKSNKITLPTIHPISDKTEQKAKRKFFRGWIMNDTFSNWKKQKTKTSSCSNPPEITI